MKRSMMRWCALGCLLAVGATALELPWEQTAPLESEPEPAREALLLSALICLNNMRMIDSLIDSWALERNAKAGSEVDRESIFAVYRPDCPAGGSYAYGMVGEPPSCSVHGHLAALTAATAWPDGESSRTTRIAHLRQQVAGKDWAAALDLAFALLEEGEGEEGLQWLRDAAAQGYLAGLQRRAEAGHGKAQHHLGALLLLASIDTPASDADDEEILISRTVRDVSVAAGLRGDADAGERWLRRSAEQGDADAQVELARVYHAGLGRPADHDEAMRWYRRAAEQNHPEAEYMLGTLLDQRGQTDESLRWYRRAAAQRQHSAMMTLQVHALLTGTPSAPAADLDPGSAVAPAPETLEHLRGRHNKTFRFRITGRTIGTVWGTDIYSDDSLLAVAAVHAGVLRPGETGVVTVRILPGRDRYTASERHGVRSFDWIGYHDGSFSFVADSPR